jgi:thiol-disulfide isomerase/thioredoxin
MSRLFPFAALLLLWASLLWAAGCKPMSFDNGGNAPLPGTEATTGESSASDAATGETPAPAAPAPAADKPAPATNNAGAAAAPDTVAAPGANSAGASAEPPRPTLTIGDPAPPLVLAKWMKGDPIDGFVAGKAYVVEFWATWCGPCRMSMPHISQLQTQYGPDVTFVGISHEKEEVVQGFLDQPKDAEGGPTWNEVIRYAIALDAPGQPTGEAYMRAAQQHGIPTAFVVGKDGHIEWIGHPGQLDAPLSQIVNGPWDRAAALAEFQSRQQLKVLRTQVFMALRRAQTSNGWSELDGILQDAETAGTPAEVLNSLKLDVAILSARFDEAHRLAEELSATAWNDAEQLNELAWTLVTRIPRETQNHELLLRIAHRASELSHDQDGSILDTVARVYYDAGDLQQAVAWQRKAVEHSSLKQLAETLKKYEAEAAP